MLTSNSLKSVHIYKKIPLKPTSSRRSYGKITQPNKDITFPEAQPSRRADKTTGNDKFNRLLRQPLQMDI